MKRMKSRTIPAGNAGVVGLVAAGASPVWEVMDVMPDGKARAYTTILSVMQVMEKKGLVSHVAQGNAHVYQARSRARR